MAKQETPSAQALISEIAAKRFRSIYLLMGEEPFYIDRITDAIIEHALTEEERDFNQTILYGADMNETSQVINAARRYPMMSDRQLVVLREAQMIRRLDDLLSYCRAPLPSTVLVISYKYNTLKNKEILAAVERNGIVFESKRVWDNQVPAFINRYVADQSRSIEPKATQMIADWVGTDLSRLAGELDKLLMQLTPESPVITAATVEKNVGISKDFNNFELIAALAARNVFAANQIIHFFAKNPKQNPLVVTITTLFNYFSNILLAHYMPDKSDNALTQEFKLNYNSKPKFISAMRNYSPGKCVDIIAALRIYDGKSKGINANGVPDSELLKELVYKILH